MEEPNKIAKFVHANTTHGGERYLASLILKGIPMRLNERIQWQKVKEKYEGRVYDN